MLKKKKVVKKVDFENIVSGAQSVRSKSTIRPSLAANSSKAGSSTNTSFKLQRLEIIKQLEKALEENASPEMEMYRNKYMKRLTSDGPVLADHEEVFIEKIKNGKDGGRDDCFKILTPIDLSKKHA